MSQLVLFESDNHKNILLQDHTTGEMVPANQHLIVHNGKGMLLDPGGHKVHSRVYSDIATILSPSDLEILFFSHQDPDIVAAANFWFMMTSARGYISRLWTRFVAHFGIEDKVLSRMSEIPDTGMRAELNGAELLFIPAHFLHSAGNFQVYDPASKILYSGDLGASIGTSYRVVEDFQTHLSAITGFHQRYMPTLRACELWAKMIRALDIEIIAPQHGAIFQGKEVVTQFIDWVETCRCGVDIMEDVYKLP